MIPGVLPVQFDRPLDPDAEVLAWFEARAIYTRNLLAFFAWERANDPEALR